MDALSSMVPVIGFMALFAAVLVFSVQAVVRRKKAMLQMSGALGFSYAERDDGALFAIKDFKIYQTHHSSENAQNVMKKSGKESEIMVFDYFWRRGSGKNSTSATHTILWFQSPLLAIPRFALAPEYFFHKLGEMLGFKDIDFNLHPDFSKRFRLTGTDEAGIRTFFTDARIGKLEQLAGKFSMEGNGGNIVVYRQGAVPVKELQDFIKQGLEIVGIFKG